MFKSIGLAMPLAIAVSCFSAVSVSAATIFTDSFESPENTNNWQVYPDKFGDWFSDIGTGIEVQTSGVVVQAQDGDQYIELDSDSARGGDGSASTTNSSMTRTVNLVAGTYLLEWYYQPRTNTLGDNIIDVYLAGASESLLTNMIDSANGAGRSGWEKRSATFTVDGLDNDYALTFIANGRENTLGGFIDNVTLSQVPLPAGLPLLLVGAAALGFAGRKKRS